MELSDRGHHFIADDAVVIEKKGESVVGKASSVTGGQMNVCGAGIVEIPINLGAPFCYKINLIVEIGIAKINSESNKDLIGFTDGSDELLNIRKVKLHGQTLTLASSIEELTK